MPSYSLFSINSDNGLGGIAFHQVVPTRKDVQTTFEPPRNCSDFCHELSMMDSLVRASDFSSLLDSVDSIGAFNAAGLYDCLSEMPVAHQPDRSSFHSKSFEAFRVYARAFGDEWVPGKAKFEKLWKTRGLNANNLDEYSLRHPEGAARELKIEAVLAVRSMLIMAMRLFYATKKTSDYDEDALIKAGWTLSEDKTRYLYPFKREGAWVGKYLAEPADGGLCDRISPGVVKSPAGGWVLEIDSSDGWKTAAETLLESIDQSVTDHMTYRLAIIPNAGVSEIRTYSRRFDMWWHMLVKLSSGYDEAKREIECCKFCGKPMISRTDTKKSKYCSQSCTMKHYNRKVGNVKAPY